MKRNKISGTRYDQLSDEEKFNYREKVFALAEKISNDEKSLKKLIVYTNRIMMKFAKDNSIYGREAVDFVQDALLKTAEGKRYFEGNSEEEFLSHLYYIIPSLVSNELKKIKDEIEIENESGKSKIHTDKYVKITHVDYCGDNDDDNDDKNFEIIIKGTDTSELDRIIFQETIDKTQEYIYKEFDKKQDYIGPYLFDAHLDGVQNPHKHEAETLNLPIEDVRNTDKRLKRIVNKAKRFGNEG